ncbi:phosphate ABC transporter permease PstA [Acidothermaceae bacterium B102]|nr:phosphate ABC transporter permease PstA [Acidothermaceae bacterium B102]
MTAVVDAPVVAVDPPQLVEPEPQLRRRTSSFRPDDAYAFVGALLASLSVTTSTYTTLAPFSGPVGFVVIAWFAFVLLYALLVSVSHPGQAVKDKVAAVVVQSIAALLVVALVTTVGYLFYRAWAAMTHLNFYTKDMGDARPTDSVANGLVRAGILHGIVATLEQITISTLITVPVGLTCAVLLNEIPGRFSRIVRTVTEAMTALPSIVAGLFIFTTYILLLGRPKSGFAAALALSIMMLPIIIRAADVVLRLVPGTLKEASLALGAGNLRTLWQVTLPTARSGLATAVILGMARGIGETSPVLITAGVATHLNTNPFTGPQPSLPLLTLLLTRSSSNSYVARGFGAGGTLLVVVLVLFIAARIIGGRGAGNLSPRQQRRAAAASRRDVARWEQRQHVPTTPLDEPNVVVLDPPPTSS